MSANDNLALPVPLPPKWKAETYYADNDPTVVVLEWPGNGYVTVDRRRRNFGPGRGLVHKSQKAKYSGRNWEKRLFTDAIDSLLKVYEG